MTRTTLDLDTGVLDELKKRRASEGRSIGAIASELLAQALSEDPAPTHDLEWRARSLGALIDIEDADAVWAALDDR